MTLLDCWQKLQANADAAIKVVRRQKGKPRTSPKTVTPAQLLAAWQAAVADLGTAVNNLSTAQANVVDALSAEATAYENLATASAAEKEALNAYLSAILPGE